jgi:extradiol dioxygenase family protein
MTRHEIPIPPFHLAVPVDDLAVARRFYGETLDCRRAVVPTRGSTGTSAAISS